MFYREQLPPTPPPAPPPAPESPSSPPPLPNTGTESGKLRPRERVAAIGLCLVTLCFAIAALKSALRLGSLGRFAYASEPTPAVVRLATDLSGVWIGLVAIASLAAVICAARGRKPWAVLVPGAASVVVFVIALYLHVCFLYPAYRSLLPTSDR